MISWYSLKNCIEVLPSQFETLNISEGNPLQLQLLGLLGHSYYTVWLQWEAVQQSVLLVGNIDTLSVAHNLL